MAAPLDMTTPLQVAQAAAPASPAAGTPTRTAQLPTDCERVDSIVVTIDVPTRYHPPQIPNVAAFRKQTSGENVVVSTDGHGPLVMDHFVAAAHSAHPPVVVLGDGTVLTAAEVLARPEQLIAPDLCSPQQLAQAGTPGDMVAAATPPADATAGPVPPADVAPAAGPATIAQLANIAPAAGGAAAGGGGEASGGHFNSSFAPAAFDGLNYGGVDPLAFGRTPPVLSPGSGRVEAAEPAPPPPPPPVNDATLHLGPVAAKEDLGNAGDQIAGVPSPQSGAVPITIAITSPDAGDTVTGITISGVPAGVTFNHGQAAANGTWLLAPSDLPGLALTGVPADSDRDFTLTVQVAMSQDGVALPPLTGTIAVTIDAVADIPTLQLTGTANGAEDTPISLPSIAAALQDSDGSETLTLTISGVPAGATLSAGTDQGGGVWALTGLSQAQLDALTITPPADFSGTFDLTVTATTTEGATVADGGELQDADNTASTSQTFTVTVDAVRDSTLEVGATAIKDDLGQAADQIAAVPQPGTGAQPLAINLTVGANESIDSITISGVPTGVTLNHGTDNGNGTWSLTQADLAGLTINGAPADSDADFTLSVTVGLSQGGQALPDLTGAIQVTVDAVADVPTLALAGTAHGNEDTAIALPDIAAALQDSDGSETLTLTVSGVPAGATLSAGTDLHNGSWDLTGLSQVQLDALTITPPANYSGTFNLTVTATATETATVAGGGELQDADNTASTSQSFTVTVDAVRDSTLAVSDSAIKEDLGQAANQIAAVPQPGVGAQPLAINLTLGANESVDSIAISGVPTGVTLNHGTDNGNGTWSLTQGDLTGLAISGAPADSDADFTLGVTVGLSQGGQPLPDLIGSIQVTVDAVADVPTLNLAGTAQGNEDTAIALPDIAAALQDSDGSETLTLTVSGVPTGATLSAGTDLHNGSWDLTGLSQAQLDTLTITPPADFSGSFNLTVTATATEAATVAGGGELQDADNTATTSQIFIVTVDPARDSTLSVSDTAIKEDLGQAADQIASVPSPTAGPQPLTVTLSVGTGETVDSITISGVPAGVTFNHGTDNGNGTWSLTQTDLSGLTINGVTADSDADFALGVTVGLSQNGTTLADLTGTIHVTVDAVADLPTLTLTGTAHGNEDSAIALPDIAAALQDATGETLTLTISGVPAGATLSAGTDLHNGSWVLTGLTQAQLDALTITPRADYSGSFNLTVTATSTEAATVAGGGELQDADNTASTSQSFTVTVDPVRDSTLAVSDTAIKEDLGQAADQIASVPSPGSGPQALAINLTVGANEHINAITISGVPTGITFNHGTDNGNGTWSLTQADLTGLTINGAPADSDVDFTLGVTVGVSQNGTALPDLSGSIQVTVDAVADVPTLTLTGTAHGNEDTAIALPDIAAALQDSDGSETLTLTVSGVPTGASLSAGTDLHNGTWDLTGLSQAQLDALTITPAADFSGSFNLTITASATEAATVAGGGELQNADNTATTSQSFTVTVNPVRDSTLSVSDSAIKEDLGQAADQIASVPQPAAGPQALAINLSLGANEVATSVTITGVPAGVAFNYGSAGPGNTWVLTPAELSGLQITAAPSDSDSDFTLGVVVGVAQNGQVLPSLTGSIAVTVDAVADVPTLTLTGTASGTEDSAIALPHIAAGLQDGDGSETLSLTVSGVPTGATLSAGVDQGGGVWALTGLTQAQLDSLTITPPANYSGTFNLSVTATATEAATVAGGGELQNADNIASTTQSFSVTVTPARDSTFTVADTAVKEDLGQAADQIASVPQPSAGPQPLAITLSVGANETVTSITLSGVPTDVTFNHGTDNGNGTWSLTQGDLSGLTINGVTPDSDADFNLGVTVALSQNGTALPALSGTIHVIVDAVADLPTLTLTGTASGNQGAAIALPDITAALQDATGETLTVTVSGVPAGATLSAGANLGNGTWDVSSLSQAQLNALTITPAAGYYGNFNLTVTATAHEGATVAGGGELTEADNTASTSQSFQVHVNALPSGASASTVVSEAGIEAVGSYSAGTQAASNSEAASGTLGYSFGGDGQAASGTFTWSGTVGAADPDGGGAFSGLKSHGESVVWSVSADGLTLTGSTATSHETVATLTITNVATGAYSYEQIGTFDHPDVGQSGSADLINLGFGYTIKDGTGDTATGSLTVGVQDDAPIAGVVNKTGTEGAGANTNLLVVLDVSGSMDDPSGLTNLSRLDVAKAAVTDLIEQYDALGDVRVHIVTFSSGATDVSGVWVTASQAIAYLDSLAAGGSTNYDAALATAETAFATSGKLADGQNVAYFLSDGQPNRPSGSAGIDSTEQASWESFLNTNNIKTYALGMGTGVDDTALKPVAYDGIAHSDIAPVVVSDMSQLSQTLTDTIPAPSISGSIVFDSIPVSEFGADGGHVHALTVDGTVYTYDPSGGGSIAVTGTDHHVFDTTTDTLSVTTANSGTIALNMDTGAFVYTLPAGVTQTVTETFNYTIVDTEGDSASSSLNFTVQNVDQPPQVNSDTVITSINGNNAAIAVPDWALTANDTDPDGDTVAVTGTSNASGGTAAHAGTTTTYTDSGHDGGTFDYTGTANGATDTGHVTVDRSQENSSTLNGTGLGEILIGQTGNDTINGYEGNDILIGNGGTDNLQAGAGDDILVFQGVGSTYNGGTGFDTLRIADSASGTIDLRSTAFADSQIENIDKLALDGGNNVTVRLDYQGVLDFEPGNNTLRITGSAGDTVDLNEAIGTSGSDKWIKTASSATVDTYTFTSSNVANPVVTLIVDHQVTVV